MPKRKSGSLTGGTGDVNPQWFNLNTLAIPASGAYADASTTLPRERLPYGNKSQVLELLKLQFNIHPACTLAMTAATFTSLRMYVLTRTFGTVEPVLTQNTGNVVHRKDITIANTAAAPAVNLLVPINEVIDLTDDDGHGMLIATDSIFIGAANTAFTTGGTATINAKLYYRWKNVSLQEYIGIVQSQQ